ncbi:MAG TPA: erythromycin esterase family protein [Thermoanaerobaculia bacterium]|nr:erythromycin esterase family protein [Thermoanaerobaculia bacterium]
MKTTAIAVTILLASLPGAARISGVVKNRDGMPVKGMHVAVTLLPIEAADDVGAETDSDDAGHFSFSGLAPGKYTVGASSADVAAGWTEIEVKADGAAPVTITVGGDSRLISGAIRGPALPKAHVIVGRWDSKGATMFSAPIRDGRYAIAIPREGRYAIEAIGNGGESATLMLRPDETSRDLTIERTFKQPPFEVVQWIAKKAIPLKTVVAGNGFDDMRPIRGIVGDARIVTLGEATHGTKEFFQFKHRMLEFLVANAGFDVFAIEASFPDALAVNDYVLNGAGDPARALSGMLFWTWNTEEVLALIKWMRAWNDNPKHTRKLRFYGFDMQNPASSVERLRKYFEKADATALPLLDRLTPALNRDLQKPTTPDQQKEAMAALDEIAARIDAAAGLEQEQVTLIRQAVRMFGAAPLMTGGIRDAAMAENIRWILDHEPAGTKMVVWAHNGHVATEEYSFAAGGNMGTHLRSMFGKDLVAFGAGFNRGSFQAVGGRKRPGLVEHTVGPLETGSFDRTLADAGPPIFVLDLRHAPGAVRDWLDSPLKNRTIGAMFDDDNPKGYAMSIHPSRSFDAVFFIRDTTSAVPVGGRKPPPPPLPPPAPAAVNLDFAHGIEGWMLMPAATKGGNELSATSDGCVVAPCVRLSRNAQSSPFGVLSQRIDATPYRGKKIRFRAKVRSQLADDQSSARIWLRVDLPGGGMGFFDNMQSRAPKSLPEWTDQEIVGDVAPDAEAIVFGGLFIGSGIAWYDETSLEIVAPQ